MRWVCVVKTWVTYTCTVLCIPRPDHHHPFATPVGLARCSCNLQFGASTWAIKPPISPITLRCPNLDGWGSYPLPFRLAGMYFHTPPRPLVQFAVCFLTARHEATLYKPGITCRTILEIICSKDNVELFYFCTGMRRPTFNH
jgi:hypothetical protein